MQARMLMWLFITITSFCFGAGKEGIRSLWNEPLDTSDWFQPAQRKALFEWPPCSCQGSPDILHHPGWSCQTSVFKQRLPFRPGQDASLVIPIWVSPEQNEVTKYLGVSLLWLEATIWPEIPEFEPLSARLHWNSSWVILTSMSLFVLFKWVLWQWVPPPSWIWGVVASLRQKRLPAQKAHTWLSDNPGRHCPQFGSGPALQTF